MNFSQLTITSFVQAYRPVADVIMIRCVSLLSFCLLDTPLLLPGHIDIAAVVVEGAGPHGGIEGPHYVLDIRVQSLVSKCSRCLPQESSFWERIDWEWIAGSCDHLHRSIVGAAGHSHHLVWPHFGDGQLSERYSGGSIFNCAFGISGEVGAERKRL